MGEATQRVPIRCSSSSKLKPRWRITRRLAHIVSGTVIVFSVMRCRPLTLRIASICSSGSAAKIALPTPDAWSGTRLPSRTIVRIVSRHWTWSMNTASVPSRMPRFAVSPDWSMSRRM